MGSRVLIVTDLPEFRYFGHRIWHLPLLSAADQQGDIFTGSTLSNFFTQRKPPFEEYTSDTIELGVDALPDLCRWTHVLLIGSTAGLPPSLPLKDQHTDGAASIFDVDLNACPMPDKPNRSQSEADYRKPTTVVFTRGLRKCAFDPAQQKRPQSDPGSAKAAAGKTRSVRSV